MIDFKKEITELDGKITNLRKLSIAHTSLVQTGISEAIS